MMRLIQFRGDRKDCAGKDGSRRVKLRIAAWAAAAVALAATLGLNVFTLAQIPRAATRVPWVDQWAMIEEFSAYAHGDSLWQILWSPYWGHRLVIPRLIFFADIQWASYAPLTWLTMAVQFAHILLLIALAWMLFGRGSLLCFALSTIVVLNLMLSPNQMQNFTWSMQTMFPLVYAAGSASFLCLGLSRGSKPVMFRIFSVAAASVGSLTMPNGIFIWPVLVAQAVYLRLDRRFTSALALIGTAVIVLYTWHYQRQPLGMGIGGMLRHPLDALCLIGLLLGAPLDSLPLEARIAAALIGMAVAGYLAARVLRRDPPEARWVSVLVAVHLFLLLSAASTVAGRLGPEWLHRAELTMPSKYFTLICAFWTSTGILALYAQRRRLQGVAALSLWGVMFCCLMFWHPKRLFTAAEDWADFFRGADAVGGAILLDAPDEQLLGYLLPSQRARDECVDFMRRRHIGIFAEPRAAWAGKPISEICRLDRKSQCIGGVEFMNRLTASDSAAWRVEGWAMNRDFDRVPDDLIITDRTGQVVGLARGGFRHRYIPGFFADAQSTLYHGGVRRSEWLGYVREPALKPWTVYGLLDGSVCRVADVP